MRHWPATLSWVLLVTACAAPGVAPPSTHPSTAAIAGWSLAELAAVPQARALLQSGGQPVGVLTTSFVRAGWQAAQRLERSIAGVKPELVVAEGMVANAFAFYKDGAPQIAANLAMVELLGDDEPAWAALIGHELAHLNLRHQDVQAQRRATEETTSGLLGIALAVAGVPFGSTLADTATTLAERGYSRDDEREADRKGVEYMLKAGYDPEGAVRLQVRLGAANAGRALPFLSTHPSGGERVETMRALVRELGAQAK